MQLGASVQTLVHRLDSMASPRNFSASADASTPASLTYSNYPPHEYDRSCQVGQSLVVELCHCLRQHESQATCSPHGHQSPPALSCAALPPPSDSFLPTPEPQALTQLASQPHASTHTPTPKFDTRLLSQANNPHTQFNSLQPLALPDMLSGPVAPTFPAPVPNYPLPTTSLTSCVAPPVVTHPVPRTPSQPSNLQLPYLRDTVAQTLLAPADIRFFSHPQVTGPARTQASAAFLSQLLPSQPAATFQPYEQQQPVVPPVTIPLYQTASLRSHHEGPSFPHLIHS